MTPSSNDGAALAEAAPDPDALASKLRGLFTKQNASTEQLADQLTNAVIRRFSASEDVSTSIQVRTLANGFLHTLVPEDSIDLAEYLRFLADQVLAHSSHNGSPLCLSHMTPPTPHFMPQLAKLVAATNQNLVRLDASKALTPFERETLGLLHRLVYGRGDEFYREHVQEPNSALGMIVSGGTLANVAALWCARASCLPETGDFGGAEQDGLANALRHHACTGALILGSASMHYSFIKAAGMLGLGRKSLVQLPVDRADRLELAALRQAVRRCRDDGKRIVAIVGVAGSTNAGAVDPLRDIAEIAQEAGCSFHVDAAWGCPVLFSARHRHKLDGIELADSVTIDGHKQLYLPLGTGVVLFSNPSTSRAIQQEAHYILRPSSHDQGKRTIEGSRPASALFLHAALHMIGRSGFEFLIDEGIRQARYAAAAVRARPELELLIDPELNILLYRCIPPQHRAALEEGRLTTEAQQAINRFNEKIHRVQRGAGHILVSRTSFARGTAAVPMVALRAVFANPLTTDRHIDTMLEDQLRIALSVQLER